jgi:hypothetical protein
LPDRIHRAFTLSLVVLLCHTGPTAWAGDPVGSGVGASSVESIGIRLLEAPVARRHDPRALVYVVDHVRPGTSFRRRMLVRNGSDTARRIRLYPAAADVRDGNFLIFSGHTSNELSDWISLDRDSAVVPAHDSAEFQATVSVPRSASRGERYAVIWAEVGSRSDSAHNVGVTSRVGIRVYLDVGPGGEPPSDFQITRVTAVRTEAGVPRLVATVHNTGERALDLSGSLRLRDGPGGSSAGPFPVRGGVTPAPGETVPVVVALNPGLPDGPWTATLALHSGQVQRQVTMRVTFPPPGQAHDVSLGSRLLSPLSIGGSVAILVLLLSVVLLRRRRRARARVT